MLVDLDDVISELRLDGFANLADRKREGGLFEFGYHGIPLERAQVAAVGARSRHRRIQLWPESRSLLPLPAFSGSPVLSPELALP